jgi:hypothetical protein
LLTRCGADFQRSLGAKLSSMDFISEARARSAPNQALPLPR